MKRKRIARRWHDTGGLGTALFITRHNEGVGDVYRAESGGAQIAWVGNEDAAKMAADEFMTAPRHACSAECSEWTAIPQPEPMTETQKRNAAACFRLLKFQVENELSHATGLSALETEYSGMADDLIEHFDDQADKGLALQHIEAQLLLDIEPVYWPQPN